MTRFRYRKTSYFLIPAIGVPGVGPNGAAPTGTAPAPDGALLAVDAGWPCTLFEYARAVKESGRHLEQIRWALVTHFHMDHAGLIADFIARGVECFVIDRQADYIGAMEATIRKNYPDYRAIDTARLRSIASGESRELFHGMGLPIEVVPTPGHSADSVTIVTDEGEAMIGDLYPPDQLMPDDATSHRSWRLIAERGGRQIYPSHAPEFVLAEAD